MMYKVRLLSLDTMEAWTQAFHHDGDIDAARQAADEQAAANHWTVTHIW